MFRVPSHRQTPPQKLNEAEVGCITDDTRQLKIEGTELLPRGSLLVHRLCQQSVSTFMYFLYVLYTRLSVVCFVS